MQIGTWGKYIGVASIGVGGWLMLFAPDTVLGLESGVTGSIALLAGIWLTVGYLLQPAGSSSTSFGEKQAWLGLGVTSVAVAYTISKLAALGWPSDIHAPGVQRLPLTVIALLVGAGAFEQMLRRREPAIAEDERDQWIRQRATSISHSVLVCALLGLSVTLALTPADRLSFATPVLLAYSLLGSLALGEIARYAGQLWLYRRERA